MIELTYEGSAQTVNSGDKVPFNSYSKRGRTERYVKGTNKVILTRSGKYLVTTSANVALPSTGTVGTTISLGLTCDGDTIDASTMDSTPYALNVYNNVSSQVLVDVYTCCGSTVTLKNVGSVPAGITNQTLTAFYLGGY